METDRFDVLILTALPEELSALRAIDVSADGPWAAAQDPAGFTYHHRRFRGGGGALRVAAAATGGMGEPATAARATALIDHLDPACLAMCGLCAGDRRDVFLGDVIVADRVYSYDHGKLIATVDADGRRDERFLHDVETYSLDAAWKVDIAEFVQDPSWCAELVRTRPLSLESQERWLLRALLKHGAGGGPSPVDDPERRARCPDWPALIGRLKRGGLIDSTPGVLRLTEEGERRARDHEMLYPDGDPGDPPFRVHVGAIATGKTVRSDPEIWKRLERLVRKTLGLEMEAAAVGQIAHQRKRRAIVVKAVSDGADHDKDDSFRAFAARASAELLLRFLCHKAPLAGGASARPDGAPARPDGVSARPDGVSARPDGVSARPDGVSARPDAGAVAPFRQPARDGAALAASRRDNPFQTEGSLEAGHPTYVERPCDAALAEALVEASLISLEGEFRIGKSSLLLRAHAELARGMRACFLDLSGFRVDDEHVFYRSLFHQLSRRLKLDRPLSDWHELGDEAGEAPLALCFDEFGHLTPGLLATFVPSLHHLATRPDRPVRIVVCLPGSIEHFLQRSGPKNPKYSSGFRRIRIGPLDDAGVARLLGLLPEGVRGLADARRAEIAALSAGHPRAVQALCRRLFDAAEERAPEAALSALIHDRRSYE